MGYFYSGVDPAYIYKRKGDNTDPYVSLHETAQVVNGVITLKEIPDYPTKVIVKKLDGTTLTEVTSATLQTNQYRVDYTTGVVYFPNTLEGNKLTLDYKGTGYVSFPASRVWIDTDNTASGKTIQQLVTDMDNVKTNWLTAVNAFSNIATTYPTPSLGDTVQTTNDSRIYRFNGSAWVNTQQYTSNAITNFQNRLDGLSKVPNEYEWIATQGQLTYTFPANSQYDPNSKWLDVSVGGARVSPSLVQKNSSTQFTLLVNPSDIPSGVRVVAKWIEGFISATQGHKGTHEVGGFDEIDVTKLKNYQESIATPLAKKADKSAVIPQQDTPPIDAEVGTIWLDTSDNAYQGTVFQELNSQLGEKVKSQSIKEIRDNSNVFEYSLDGLNWKQILAGGTVGFALINDYGADATGVNDSLAAFNSAFATGKPVSALPGTYKVSGTVVIPRKGTLILNAGVTIKPNGNFNVIQIKPESKIYGNGAKIDTSDIASFTMAGIYATGQDRFSVAGELTIVNGFNILGKDHESDVGAVSTSYTGKGIHFYSGNNWAAGYRGQSYVAYVQVSNINIGNFYRGIWLEREKHL
jgi:hypothetical protein